MTNNYSAWNPGLESDIPPVYRALETIYRPENVTSLIRDVEEISKQTGLSVEELVVFRPERLLLHELIVRVTADIVVHEGEDETELGKNYREIVGIILAGYIRPHMAEVIRAYHELRDVVTDRVRKELNETLFTGKKKESSRKGPILFRLLGKTKGQKLRQESIQEREQRVISVLKEKGRVADNQLSNAIFKSFQRVLGSLVSNRGYIGPDKAFLTSLICNHVCNNYGSEMIGKKMDPWIEQAVSKEGYTWVPDADAPILISLKGASAAGKSYLRPMLKQVMKKLKIQSKDYATISPDIWRRLLLDYESLGDAYKYAGRLTSHEVNIIDRKLDHYIRKKADRHGSIPHLLVDRFRFDSFSSERISKILHGTYLKHVDTLYMYFVVTPPDATVERGWERGLRTGRYKAVEDYLDHSVEAYTGMPKLLFKWLAHDRPLFRYEFLDNSVPKGAFPRTIAYGTRKELNILDCVAFVNIERYQKINFRAKTPQEVYPSESVFSVANNIGFLKQCLRKIPCVNFIDPASGDPYARVRNGVFSVLNTQVLEEKSEAGEWTEVFKEIAPRARPAANGRSSIA